jgi:hypothetical protein
MSQIVPIPRTPISIRTATLADLPWIDALHKTQRKALGYWPTMQFEEHILGGFVLVAEEDTGSLILDTGGNRAVAPSIKDPGSSNRLGYIISRDRYLKRDELGVIYQLNVVPAAQRGLIGAFLLKAAFERSAYGCRLYCCWCAQDLKANEFWEAMGFVPLAFRAGGAGRGKKKRVHIFWQKRIGSGDVETKWWYPFKTDNGAIRADRVVFPIPSGVNWRDVRAIEVPVLDVAWAPRACLPEPKKDTGTMPVPRNGSRPGQVGILVGGRMKYVMRPGYVAPPESETMALEVRLPAIVEKAKRKKKPVAEIDPAFLAKTRELRDRYLEHVNGEGLMIEGVGKYHVAKTLSGVEGTRGLAEGVSRSPNYALPAPSCRQLPAA